MPTYAYIDEALTVTRMQPFSVAPDIAPHKKRSDGGLFLRPVVDPGAPEYFAPFQMLDQSIVVQPDRVLIVYTVLDKDIGNQILVVKAEAQKRIYERYPQWKQANMTARAVELLNLGKDNWTQAEIDEAAALDAAWAWIKSVREASGAIEAMSPIPRDYASNKWWPE